MPTIHIGETELTARRGEGLLDALRRGGVFVDAPCGGKGRCGKCRVHVSGGAGPVTAAEREQLTGAELRDGVRLACECAVQGDLTVRLTGAQEMEAETAHASPIALDLPHALPGEAGLAVDIGTTTVAAYFYSLTTGERLAVFSGMNRQREFGADVISRIKACGTDPGALEKQRALIAGQLNAWLAEFAARFPEYRVSAAVIAANTTMLHLLAGLDPAGIARAPYTPQSLFGVEYRGAQLGLDLPGAVYLAPCISAYVGADITAGIVGCGLDRTQDICLFLDVGTNGEMALILPGGEGTEIICCSTAAGPAFEGAHIKYGLGSVPGAINRVWITPEGLPACSTIGGTSARGICGSGLIDAVACMLRLGVLDETGLICDPEDAPAALAPYFNEEGFLLDPGAGVCVTQQDIREVQLAKSAIAAGIETLLHHTQTPLSAVSRAVIAGGFGAHINPASAAAIGLLPQALAGRFEAAGNASGLGASCALLSEDARRRLEALPGVCRNIELSGDAFFGDAYIENMCFE